MHRHSWSIAAAIAGGALIGTLTALEIGSMRYGSDLWGLGAFIGGIVAYVAVDFRHFFNGVVHAYRHTIGWRLDREYWSTYLIVFGGLTTVFFNVGIAGYIFICASTWWDPVPLIAFFGLVLLVTLTSMSALMAFSLVSPRGYSTDQQRQNNLAHCRDIGWYMIKWGNPAGMAIGLGYEIVRICRHIPTFGVGIARGVQKFASTICQFVANVFVRVHSERRTLCFVDAAIGSAIGYTFGSVFVGALAGAVLGVVNYELISVRWLKLAPASR